VTFTDAAPGLVPLARAPTLHFFQGAILELLLQVTLADTRDAAPWLVPFAGAGSFFCDKIQK
jgi:hypothetical protein